MKELNKILSELGISKVKLAKYLGVSRQMLYNYLAQESIDKWPKEKVAKLYSLLGIMDYKEIKGKKVDADYIMQVEKKLENGSKTSGKDCVINLKNFNRKEQEILNDIFNLLQQNLTEDKTKDTYNTYLYLYNFLQSIQNNKELKYILAYFSKSLGFTDPHEFLFNENQQFIFESIMFSGMTLYSNGGASRARIADTHKKFVHEIEHKKEERLSRTQELNNAKVQALRELGYTEINADNAKEVLYKIAEIESRKV